jgi:AmmeMemoRadiSam system protein A
VLLLVIALTGCVKKAETESDSRREASAAPVPTAVQQPFAPQDRAILLGLARNSLRLAVSGESAPSVPAGLPAHLLDRKGCFVTLTIQGELRGCIGNIMPERPLAEAVISNARLAALKDSRFPPVTAAELAKIEVEVSVLTVPEPLAFTSAEDLLRRLRPHIDGVVLQIGMHRSTFLPQVWEQLPDPNDFLNHLSEKAGAAPVAWQQPGTQVAIYHVEAFKESQTLSN